MKRMMVFSLGLCLMMPVYPHETCDRSLIPVGDNITKYKNRGCRCEGFYKSEITQTTGIISVVGILQGKLNYDLDEAEIVEIQSPHVNDQNTFVRAQGIPLKLYYRMDADLSPGETLSWPIKDVIKPAKIPSTEIGILGWIEEGNRRIYVPLLANPKINRVINDDTIRIYFRPNMDVMNIRYALYSHKDKTTSGWKDAYRTRCDAGLPILIQLPDQQTGTITVTVQANLQSDENEIVEKIVTIRVKEQ